MFTKADILARLQNGDTVDEIAKEVTDVLNAAEAEYEEAKQADAEATRVMNAKRVAVNTILDGLCDYLVAVGTEELLEELKDVDTDEVIEALDSMVAFVKSLEKLKELQFPVADLHKAATINPKVHKIVVDADADNADRVIRDFLKTLSL